MPCDFQRGTDVAGRMDEIIEEEIKLVKQRTLLENTCSFHLGLVYVSRKSWSNRTSQTRLGLNFFYHLYVLGQVTLTLRSPDFLSVKW